MEGEGRLRFWNDSTAAIFLLAILCEALMEAGVYCISTFTSPWKAHVIMGPLVACFGTLLGSSILTSQRAFRKKLEIEIAAKGEAQQRQAEVTRQLTQALGQLEFHNSRLLSFSEFTHGLLSCISEPDIYECTARFGALLFPASIGALYRPDANGFWRAATSWPNANNGLITRVRLVPNQQPPNAAAKDLISALRQGIGNRSCLGLPLISGNDLIGVLYIETQSENGCDEHAAALSSRTAHMAKAFCEEITLAFASLRLRTELSQQAIRDPLTGLYNRRYLEEALARELKRASRQGSAVSVLMVDLDHFKLLNDQFGHGCGDEVLKGLGNTILSHCRGEDVACRYGGEEFLLVLPNTDTEGAVAKAQHLRSHIKKLSALTKYRCQITASVGVATYPHDGMSMATVVKSADAAMYAAKRLGRDRVCRSSELALVNT